MFCCRICFATTLLDHILTRTIVHQKMTTLLRENKPTPNNDKKSNKLKKDLSKGNSDSSRRISSKNEVKDKTFRQSRDLTEILGDSIMKDVKDWELTDASDKVAVKFFRGATTSQMKSNQIQKISFYIVVLMI